MKPKRPVNQKLFHFQILFLSSFLQIKICALFPAFDPLEWEDHMKEMATHFSILAWEIPWTEDAGRL